jgi:Icc protein
MLKFLVMSDLHLVSPGQLSHSIDTTARLDLAVAHINEFHNDAAFCILAGDLTDIGDAASYARLADHTASLPMPLHMTLGNHDDRGAFAAQFGQDKLSETGYADRIIDDESGYRIIMLDTLIADTDAGDLAPVQLEFLQNALDTAHDRPVIIVMHHNPAPFGVPMDFIRLGNAEEFAAIAQSHPDIRQVITGHVHKSTAGSFRGLPFTTISGNHYNLLPRLVDSFSDIPRVEGPGQIGVVLATDDTVVVHQENFYDRHQAYPPELFAWEPDKS